MKEFLYDILIDPFRERDLLSLFMGLFIWCMFLLSLFFIVMVSIYFIDSSYLPTKKGDGVVIKKRIVDDYSTTTYVMSGKMLLPITTHHEETYQLKIIVDGLINTISVPIDVWDKSVVGEVKCCEYSIGRVSETLYIKSICKE